VRRTERLRLADIDHEHHALLAGLEMCDLPDRASTSEPAAWASIRA